MSAETDAHILAAGRTHPGLNRPNNEDRYAIISGRFANHPTLLAIVADGIGGHQAGEVAAEIAVEAIRETVQKFRKGSPYQILAQAFMLANRRINHAAQGKEDRRGMGTTCVTAWVIADRLFTASLGDSRIYLWRDGRFQQLTIDHTWVQEAIEAGIITPEQARHHPNARIVRRYLGSPTTEAPDFRQRLPDDHADTNAGLRLQAGDRILLCSDGLSDLVEDREIAALMRPPIGLKTALDNLIQRANDRGGRDNITAVILEVPRSNAAKVRHDMLLAGALGALILFMAGSLAALAAALAYFLLR